MDVTTIRSTSSNSILKGEQVARLTKVTSKGVRTCGRGACFPENGAWEGLESQDGSRWARSEAIRVQRAGTWLYVRPRPWEQTHRGFEGLFTLIQPDMGSFDKEHEGVRETRTIPGLQPLLKPAGK